jgi:hypothetical protein
MTTVEHRPAVRAERRARRRRVDHERQVQQAVDAHRELAGGSRDVPIGRDCERRFAYLTVSHD